MVSFSRDNDLAEAREIVRAMRALQADPELRGEARRDVPGTLDRMGVSTTARHAIAAALALGVCGVALVPGTPVYWAA